MTGHNVHRTGETTMRDEDIAIDVTHDPARGHTIRVRHLPTSRQRTATRVVSGSVGATISALRRALAEDLTGSGSGAYPRVKVASEPGPA